MFLVVLVRRDARDRHPGRREDAQLAGRRRREAAVFQHQCRPQNAGLRDADRLQNFNCPHRELAAPMRGR